MSTQLKKEDFFAATVAPSVRKVDVGGDRHVFVRGLTVAETRRWIRECKDQSSEQSFAILAVLGICDESGNRVFGDADAESLSNSLSFDAGKKISEAVLAATGLADEEPKN